MSKKTAMFLFIGIGTAVLGFIGAVAWLFFVMVIAPSPRISQAQKDMERTRQIAQDAQKVLDEYAAKNPKPEPSEISKASTSEEILDAITKKYNFNRFVDTWGPGQGLYIPQEAWQQLSFNQQSLLIDHARSKNYQAIIIGRIKSQNLMFIDRTVWEK